MKGNWINCELGSFGMFSNGINKDKHSFGKGLPFINLMDVFDKSIIKEEPKGLVEANSIELERYKLEIGDILFVRSSVKLDGVGKVCLVGNNLGKTIYSGFIIRFRQNIKNLDGIFSSYYLNSGSIRKQILKKATLSANSNINQESLKTILINVPPLSQQRKIAQILTICDDIIEKTEAAIAKYQAMKQGLLQDLFTRGIDVKTGKLRPKQEDAKHLYKESGLGWIPKEWECVDFSKVSIVNQGLQMAISERYKESGENRYLYITIQYLNDINNEGNRFYIQNPPESVICRKEDVLMVRTGNTGMIVTDTEGVFHNNFFKIDYVKDVLKKYLVYYLKRFEIQNMIMNYAGTTTIPDLKHGEFYKIPFLKPTKKEQSLISNSLESIDEKIQTEQSALSKYQQLKTGLMQDLLSGKVEVKV